MMVNDIHDSQFVEHDLIEVDDSELTEEDKADIENFKKEREELKWFRIDLGIRLTDDNLKIWDIGLQIPDELTDKQREIFLKKYEEFVDELKPRMMEIDPNQWYDME